ncbi:hypothetical protein EZS27_011314 [termite gut metagenome]|uniref:AsmA domain-containing protein n=2 Tax=termite gut metagenome TaxID=433724 RepID=A0A5J4S506_9ZZZZ
MKKVLKITGTVVVILLLLMLVLPYAFRGKIESLVKSEGNKMLNAQFDYGSLNISLFRNFPKASLTLTDFWLKGVGEFENDTLIAVGEATAAVNLFSLFGNEGYDVSKIQLEDTQVKALVLSDAQVNWDIMKPSATEQEASATSSPFRIKLQSVVVENLNIIYDDRVGKMYADIRNLNINLKGDLAQDKTMLNTEAEVESLTFRSGGITLLNKANVYAKMDVDADLANSKFTLKKNEFRLNAIKAEIDGWVALNDASTDMDLALKTNEIGFKEILSLVPAIYAQDFKSLKTDGAVSLSAHAKGMMQGDTLPQFDVTFDVKDGMFRYPSLPAGVDRINIHADIKNPGGSADLTEINVNPFGFRLADNPFSVTASVKTPVSDLDFTAEAKGVLNLGMIEKVYPLEDMKLNGTVNADIAMAGKLSYIEKEQYDRFNASGTVGLSGMKLALKDMPDVDIHKSLLTFTPKYLQLSETTANIGENDITVDSRLENYLGYALKGQTLKGTLNARSNRFSLDDLVKKFLEMPTDTTALEIPENIDFLATINMKKVLFDNMTFADVNGNLSVKNGKADMKNLSMNTMGGNVVMNGYYFAPAGKIPELNAGFRMTEISFSQAYKDLDMVRRLAPLFEDLKGDFSGNITMKTDLDEQMSPVINTMQAEGTLSTKDISLSDIKVLGQIAELIKRPDLTSKPVKDLSVAFTIKDGRVSTNPFNIKAGDYALILSGSTGLDQTIDYAGKIKLPASASTISKLESVDFTIGGVFTSPQLALDTKSMASQAVEAVKEIAIEKIGEKLGLDSAVVANKDSLKKKVTEKATEKALDLLKKIK